MLAPRPQGCSVLSLAAMLMGGSVLGCRQVRLIRLIVASIVPCYWLQSLRLPATIIYHPRVISSHYSAQYCLQSNHFYCSQFKSLTFLLSKIFKIIFMIQNFFNLLIQFEDMLFKIWVYFAYSWGKESRAEHSTHPVD